jgi:hypothetical protein
MKKAKPRGTLQIFLAKLRDAWSACSIFVRHHWTATVLSAILAAIAWYGAHAVIPRTSSQAASALLSTEVQSLATLLGIMLVGIAILSSQATSEESRLVQLRPKYFELLRGGLEKKSDGMPFIEDLRKHYLKRIKERQLPEKVFPYDHPKYKTHKDLFLDICRLSQIVCENYGDENVGRQIEIDLAGLGYSQEEIIDRVVVMWYDLKNYPAKFLELVTDIFHPGNSTLYELNAGEFAERMWDETLNLRTETSIERLKNFEQFRSVWFRAGFGVYVLAIVTGLLSISSTSIENTWRPWLTASLVLGFLAIVFTVLLVHHLLRAE